MYCWWIQGVGFGYDQDYDIVMLLLTFDVDKVNVLLVYACSSL
jgi:hypothetical protein